MHFALVCDRTNGAAKVTPVVAVRGTIARIEEKDARVVYIAAARSRPILAFGTQIEELSVTAVACGRKKD